MERTALFLCQECGRAACPNCWRAGLCKNCRSTHISEQAGWTPSKLLLLTAALPVIIIGAGLILAGELFRGSSNGGCFVWPLPLIVSCGLGLGGSPLGGQIALIATVGFAILVAMPLFGLVRDRMRK